MPAWSYTNPGMDGPNTTIETFADGAKLTFHCDDGPGVDDWTAVLDRAEATWIRDRLTEALGDAP